MKALSSNNATRNSPIEIGGVFPHLAVVADTVPARTETGIGAMMPWADRLWFVTYVASKKGSGSGTGLFSIDANLNLEKHPESAVGTYADRMVHGPSDQIIIGPHIIDHKGGVRTFNDLVDVRLTAVAEHLEDPDNKVYFLGMEGEFFEADVHTLEARRLFDMTKELGIRKEARPHFKDAYTGQGRVVVANNTYEASDFDGTTADGRLGEWDGYKWSVLETCQFNTVTGRTSIGDAIFAAGADNASAILKVRMCGRWHTYRLPKGTHTQDHTVTTEWPRIREVESERWLMNCSGLFYELPAMQFGGALWGVRPICTHLRIIPDFCSWRGLLVIAGDQTTPISDKNLFVGQPQANLWFGKTDDLWRFGGKPTGWGGPWWKQKVEPGIPSDPYLVTGFEHKCLHMHQEGAPEVNLTVEIDFRGDGSWVTYDAFPVANGGYVHHEFPPGFSAHWLRLKADRPCSATAQLFYT